MESNSSQPNNPNCEPESVDSAELVWTSRDDKLRTREFNTTRVHLFRAEVQRADVRQSRLDTTTNWACAATSAALSIAFSQDVNNHVVIDNV